MAAPVPAAFAADDADDSFIGTLVGIVAESPLPVILLELPDETVLAASSAAIDVLGHGPLVIGRSVEDFTSDDPSPGLDLLVQGRLKGYETTRIVAAPEGERSVHIWVRALSETPVKHVLIVLSRSVEVRAGLRRMDPGDRARAPVIGSADTRLIVDRVSSEVEDLLGRAPEDVLHESIVGLVRQEDAGTLLLALAQATTSGHGVCFQVPMSRTDGTEVAVDVAIAPLSPAPSFAFALSALDADAADRQARADGVLGRVARLVECVGTSQSLARQAQPVPGLGRLTTRELHIVERLLAGDRVPAISRSLFLSQSTVRNHLSSVFRKLRVSTQQELIELLREQTGRAPMR